MIKNKQLIIWKLHKKVDSYFNNKKHLAKLTPLRALKYDMERNACRTAIWLMVEKDFSITSASKWVGKKHKIGHGRIADILRHHVLSKKHLELHSKLCQSRFFKNLHRIYVK